MKLKGIVLAGGRSRRFGTDKALEKIDDTTFLEYSCQILNSVAQNVTIITNSETDYGFSGFPTVKDILPEKGPLGGLYTALALFPENDLLVLTCDMPGLDSITLEQLEKEADLKSSVILFDLKREVLQPFPGIYRRGLLPLVQSQIDCNELSMQALLNKASTLQLVPQKSSSGVFRNINSPQDLKV